MASRRLLRALQFGLVLVAGLSFGSARADQPLRIGLASSPANEAVRHAAQLAEKQGLRVKIVEFTDWVTPNTALADGDVDVNYFQHIPFLENATKANNWKLAAVAPGYISWLGAYSNKLKSIDDLPNGAKISIANDPVNTGRALLFLQALGVIKLKDGADFKATPSDIIANPKGIKIVQVEAQQVVRSLPDVDLGLTFPSFVKLAGQDPAGALAFERPSNTYAIHWVTRAQDAGDPRVAQFIEVYNGDPEVKSILTKLYSGQIGFAW
ncbi:MetQ/NlpA family ABC transporter substrate-binding protein [Chelatococcus reniformis]|uniref:Lipoprotein n=1 Tax=Chelatococcus reniformis TaxID=1494448 RepID=A0A916UJ47_9HYPH|nr:MetQ/NlpA family ABC transporter substrate-binding protein [Chelatococcus reniformis]GGC75014.1 lipoprotein [Chelatococcus reniformis]